MSRWVFVYENTSRYAVTAYLYAKIVRDGVFIDDLNLDVAIEASVAATEKYPDEPRYRFHLGRALIAAGENEEGERFLTSAAEDGYLAAMHMLGDVLLQRGVGSPDKVSIRALRRSVRWYERAVASGVDEAKEKLAGAKSMLSIYAPDFQSRNFAYSAPAFIKALYEGNETFFDNDLLKHNPTVQMYCWGLALGGVENMAFRESELLQKIMSTAPRALQKFVEPEYMRKLAKQPEIIFGFFDRLTVAEKLEGMVYLLHADDMVDGQDDAGTLMMHIASDDEEVMRFFGNVQWYLDKYFRKDR